MGMPRIQWLRTAPDWRMRAKSQPMLGLLGFTPWGSVVPNAVSSYSAPADTLYCLPQVIDASDMYYATDDEGESFPAGTAFVAPYLPGAQSALSFTGAGPFTATYGLTSHGLGQTLRYLFLAYGMPAGCSAAIVFKKTSAGTVLSSASVSGSGGAQQLVDLPTFAGFNDSVDTVTATVTFTGGTPTYWDVLTHPFSVACYAVPSTLPGGWTYRSGAEHTFAHALGSARSNDWPNRPQFALATPANYVIDPAGGFWLPEYQQYTRYLGALGRTVPTVSQTYAPDIPPIPPFFPGIIVPPTPDVTLTNNGARKVRLKVTTGGLSTGGVSFTYTVTRSDTGAVITRTYTDAQLAADVDDNLGAFIPSPNVVFTTTLHVNKITPYYGVAPVATLVMHPRCDIPFPVTATNEAGVVVPGGIDPTTLVNALTGVLTVLASGVMSGTPSDGILAFTLAADGWYQVKQAGVNVHGIGENEFDYVPNQRTADRGRTGRRFYAVCSSGVLSAFTPSFSAIASGGTTLATTQGGVWAFGTIAPGVAGTVEVRVAIADVDQLPRGVTFEWSASDPACINPDGKVQFEAWQIGTTHYDGSTYASPPGAPINGRCGVVADGATGAFLNHDRDVAVYNGTLGEWQFIPAKVLQAGMYLTDGATIWSWFDGTTWKASTDPVITQRIAVGAGTTLSCSFGAFAGANGGASPHVKASWAMV